jgi:hypothetical protein
VVDGTGISKKPDMILTASYRGNNNHSIPKGVQAGILTAAFSILLLKPRSLSWNPARLSTKQTSPVVKASPGPG